MRPTMALPFDIPFILTFPLRLKHLVLERTFLTIILPPSSTVTKYTHSVLTSPPQSQPRQTRSISLHGELLPPLTPPLRATSENSSALNN